MVDPLNITTKPVYDDRITKYDMHTYNPYANASMGNSDEIRIPIQQQDLIVLPCESYLYVEGKVEEGVRAADATVHDAIALDCNCVAYMFDEIRYELNGVEVDRCKNVGVTTSIKNWISFSTEESKIMENAGWTTTLKSLNSNHFSFCVPLRLLLGFCEDYKHVIINARHELVLIRARDDINPICASSKIKNSKLKLEKVQWRVPHITLNELKKLQFLRIVEKDLALTMAFRSWELYEYPLLPTTQKHTWAVKTATQLEKPRYIILAFKTNRKKTSQDQSNMKFSQCNIRDVKVCLNSEFYPYDRMNLNFEKSQYSILYDMYIKFIKYYYGGEKSSEPSLDYFNFSVYGPFFVIDCSHQNESIKTGAVDVKIEIECSTNIPPNTAAYCLIIHDRLVEYHPLSGTVRKLS